MASVSVGDEPGCECLVKHRGGVCPYSRSARSAGSEAADAHHESLRRDPDGPPHGSYARYTHGSCRCAECREANRVACYLRRNGLGPGRRKADHGIAAYVRGCRCDTCRAAGSYWSRRLRVQRGLNVTHDPRLAQSP